jgi:hypothetical protein
MMLTAAAEGGCMDAISAALPNSLKTIESSCTLSENL